MHVDKIVMMRLAGEIIIFVSLEFLEVVFGPNNAKPERLAIARKAHNHRMLAFFFGHEDVGEHVPAIAQGDLYVSVHRYSLHCPA